MYKISFLIFVSQQKQFKLLALPRSHLTQKLNNNQANANLHVHSSFQNEPKLYGQSGMKRCEEICIYLVPTPSWQISSYEINQAPESIPIKNSLDYKMVIIIF